MPDSPRRILLVRLSHLGDVVHALPVFHALCAAHPGAEIGWAVQPEFAGLLEGLPGLARVFRFERRRGVRAWLGLLSQLRAWSPDWAIDAQGNAKSALVTFVSSAGRRSGMHPRDWREPFASRVLTDCAAPVESAVPHAMERMLALARHVAPESGNRAAPRTDPGLTGQELSAGRAAFAERFARGSGPAVVVHLSAQEDVRSWPVDHYAELVRTLSGRSARVLVLSGPEEEAEGRALQQRTSILRDVSHWIGQRGLRELAAFFSAAGEEGARMVCCDSGPMHLASACGLPVVCLSGPQDERRTGPWQPANGASTQSSCRVVRAAEPPPCAPCLARRCDHPDGRVCMIRISPATVAAGLG